MDPLRVAVVGCGAVAEIHHLPTLAACDRVAVEALVDTHIPRARQLANTYAVPTVVSDYHDIIGRVDAAIVAVPNALHVRVGRELLEQGVHVLIEKPMALTAVECDALTDAAEASGAVLAVGLDYRFFYASQFVKQVMASGWLGDIRSFDLRHGLVLASSWPVKSDYLMRKDAAGGGVLVDFGVHLLDLLLWWLGDYASVEYYDDAMGGVEADCELFLRLKSGAAGCVEVSRLRNLRNSCIIRGERGELEVALWDPNGAVRLRIGQQDLSLLGRVGPGRIIDESIRQPFRRQLDDFVGAIRDHRAPFVSGEEGRRAVALIEACYTSRKQRLHPWMFPTDIAAAGH